MKFYFVLSANTSKESTFRNAAPGTAKARIWEEKIVKHLPDSLVTYISEGLDTAWTTGKAAVFHDLVKMYQVFFGKYT